jgi:hypothetical protein
MAINDISSIVGGGGLPATSLAIQRAQERFDQRAGEVTSAAEALINPDAAGDSGDLTQAVVGMQAESVVNSVLFATFRKQSENQQELIDLIKPR